MNAVHPFWYVGGSLALALLPLFFAFVSSYLKVSIVFGMLRSGLGAQQIPGSLVIMALSIGITLNVMGPTITESAKHVEAINLKEFEQMPKASSKNIEIVEKILQPWIDFMSLHAGEREIQVLQALNEKETEQESVKKKGEGEAQKEETVSFLTLLPAFLLTELKEAFAMGFILLLPFVAIDLIVANILVGLGMFMVSPVIIALPLKLLVFLMADGWLLLTKSILQSYLFGGAL